MADYFGQMPDEENFDAYEETRGRNNIDRFFSEVDFEERDLSEGDSCSNYEITRRHPK